MKMSTLLVALLAVLAAAELCSAYPYCDSKLNETDCLTCCRSYNFKSIWMQGDGSCECSHENHGICGDATSFAVCGDCCDYRNYKTFNWDWDYNDCKCVDKRQQSNSSNNTLSEPKQKNEQSNQVQPQQQPEGKQFCSSSQHYGACMSCCRDTNYASFKWNFDQYTCTCLDKKPERPSQQQPESKQFCSSSQHYGACMTCCQDSNYANFNWDFDSYTCTCLDKRN